MDSGFQVLVRISYFSASVKEEFLHVFTKLNISLGLFPWVLSCIVILVGSQRVFSQLHFHWLSLWKITYSLMRLPVGGTS